MKVKVKILLLWLCAGLMLLFCFYTNGILPGNTTFLDIREKLPAEGKCWFIGGENYVFRNSAGNVVVAEIERADGNVKVTRVQSFPSVSPSRLRFAMIWEGMSVFQVTALVGFPVTIEPTGLETYRYAAIDGAQYQIIWTKKDGASVVSGVEKIENPSEKVSVNWLVPWIVNHLCGVFLLAAIAVTWGTVMKRKAENLLKQEG